MLPYLAGPASAVIALAGVLVAIYRLVDTRMIPAWTAMVNRHLDQVDRLLQSHDDDRLMWSTAIGAIQGDLSDLKDGVREVQIHLSTITPPASRQAVVDDIPPPE